MTTTGTYSTIAGLTVAQSIDQAFRLLKVDPAKITSQHTLVGRLTLGLMLTDWANDGVMQFIMDLQTQTCSPGVASFQMPVGSVDILNMVYRYNGQDIQIKPISRQDYLYINDKEAEGQPVCYYVDKSMEPATVSLWPVPNLDGMQVVYNRLRQIQDVGSPTNTVDVSVLYSAALVKGLAALLGEIYIDASAAAAFPTLQAELTAKAKLAYDRAKDQDRDRTPLTIKPRLGRRYAYGI